MQFFAEDDFSRCKYFHQKYLLDDTQYKRISNKQLSFATIEKKHQA